MTLIESGQLDGIKSLTFVENPSFDTVVVNADALIRVSDGHVEGEIVVEIVVGGEIELGESSVGDVELDLVGSEGEPKDEDYDADDDDEGENDLEDAIEDTATAAGEWVASVTAAGAVIGFWWWWWD